MVSDSIRIILRKLYWYYSACIVGGCVPGPFFRPGDETTPKMLYSSSRLTEQQPHETVRVRTGKGSLFCSQIWPDILEAHSQDSDGLWETRGSLEVLAQIVTVYCTDSSNPCPMWLRDARPHRGHLLRVSLLTNRTKSYPNTPSCSAVKLLPNTLQVDSQASDDSMRCVLRLEPVLAHVVLHNTKLTLIPCPMC